MRLECTSCRGLLDEEDLFCANCGTEAPAASGASAPRAVAASAPHTFECTECGAMMSYSAAERALCCPYCDNKQLQARPEARAIAPSRVLPFAIGRAQAETIMRNWLGRGFWRPGDLATAARLDAMTPVYVPYWVFHGETSTYWTADTNQTPPGARGDWFPLHGDHRASHHGLLVPASGVLSMEETAAIAPFSLATARPALEASTRDAVVEQFAVARKYARPVARRGIESIEAATCRERYVPGRCRNMRVNVVIEKLHSEPVLLPVWVAAYRYRDEVFRFLVNGESGAPTGRAPTSVLKVLVAIVLAITIAIVIVFAVLGTAAS